MFLKSTPYLAVATSASPFGPFKLRARWRPGGVDVGDIGACYDPRTRHAYLVYSVKPTTPSEKRMLHVAQLTDHHFTNISKIVSTVPYAREAPAPFIMDGDKYYIWTSRPSGWHPNAAELFSAQSMEGPWKSVGNPTSSADSFNSQVSFILTLPRPLKGFVYVADRFSPWINTSESGRYVWLKGVLPPFGSPRVAWRDRWSAFGGTAS